MEEVVIAPETVQHSVADVTPPPTTESDGQTLKFAPLTALSMNEGHIEERKIPVPPHRMTPLKNNWERIYTPIVSHLKLQIRMNIRKRQVELRTSPHTDDPGALQKAADFVKVHSPRFFSNFS
jgi:RNA-binding protein PNO1